MYMFYTHVAAIKQENYTTIINDNGTGSNRHLQNFNGIT